MTQNAVAPFVVESIRFASETWKQSLRARAFVMVANLVAFEVEILEGKSGPFVVTPSRREKSDGSDAVWRPLVELLDRDFEKAIFAEVKRQFGALQDSVQAKPLSEARVIKGGDDDLPF